MCRTTASTGGGPVRVGDTKEAPNDTEVQRITENIFGGEGGGSINGDRDKGEEGIQGAATTS